MSQYITKNKLIGLQKVERLLLEKEQLIASLQTENAMLRNIIGHVPGYLFWKSSDGKYLGCNDNLLKLSGCSSHDQFIGKRTDELIDFDPVLAAIVDKTDKEILTAGQVVTFEEEGFDHEHQPAIYLSNKAPLYDDKGYVIGLVGIGFNITERKIMEKELTIAKENAVASDHAKSQFIAVMNHELNTPLASIIGLVNLLKQENNFQDENKKIVDTIENCTHHLLGLVNQVLDFSKLEKSNASANKSFIDLSGIINEVQNLLKTTAHNKHLDLNVHVDSDINETIFADARILRQILINLVNNAIKFTENGSISIEAKILDRKPEMARIQITVTDTGCGIPSDKLDLIFEPFQQLDDAYVRQSSRYGTGLGLAIVKKLCEQLGINIHVSSAKGVGSTFSLTGEFKTGNLTSEANKSLPPKEKNQASKISSKTGNLMLAARKLRVLMVEDDPVIQYIHKKMLEQFKCRLDVVSNGRDALKIQSDHDIIFVDINLPDISGFEVIKTLRKHTNAPIIALTAHTGKKEKLTSLKAGATKFICKPVSLNQLRGLLTDALTKK